MFICRISTVTCTLGSTRSKNSTTREVYIVQLPSARVVIPLLLCSDSTAVLDQQYSMTAWHAAHSLASRQSYSITRVINAAMSGVVNSLTR
jgi:hypothetical protein